MTTPSGLASLWTKWWSPRPIWDFQSRNKDLTHTLKEVQKHIHTCSAAPIVHATIFTLEWYCTAVQQYHIIKKLIFNFCKYVLTCFSSLLFSLPLFLFYPSLIFSDLPSHGPTATLPSPSKTSSSWPTIWISSPVSCKRREYLATWTPLKGDLMPSSRQQSARLVGHK